MCSKLMGVILSSRMLEDFRISEMQKRAGEARENTVSLYWVHPESFPISYIPFNKQIIAIVEK